MDSCHEAKDVATELQLNYFYFNTEGKFERAMVFGTYKNYFNADVDTLWLTSVKFVDHVIPDDIECVCSKCNRESSDRVEKACGDNALFLAGWEHLTLLASRQASIVLHSTCPIFFRWMITKELIWDLCNWLGVVVQKVCHGQSHTRLFTSLNLCCL